MALPLVPLAISLGSGIFGGLANRNKEDPNASRLREQLMQQQSSLFKDPNLTGYQANQTDLINRNSDLERQRLLEILASRGVSGQAVGFAEGNLERNRFAKINQLQQSIPLLSRSLKMDAINSGNALLREGGKPQSNFAAGFGGNLLSTLAYLYGQGAFSPAAKKPTDGGNSTLQV